MFKHFFNFYLTSRLWKLQWHIWTCCERSRCNRASYILMWEVFYNCIKQEVTSIIRNLWMLNIMQTEFRLWLPKILIILEALYRKEYNTGHRSIKDNQIITLNVIFTTKLIIQSLSRALKHRSFSEKKQYLISYPFPLYSYIPYLIFCITKYLLTNIIIQKKYLIESFVHNGE